MTTDNQLATKRHSLAHLLAAAVLELWPDTKNTIGPAIDNGFYYDFEFPTPITEKDLVKIEKKMRELIKDWDQFSHREVTTAEGKNFFSANHYKQELIDDIVARGEPITLYTVGLPTNEFTDLCRGGHVERMGGVAPDSWKLSHLAGAYWRGDEKNKMLTRIYGLAFNTKAELAAYEQQMIEAEKRDHRKLGKELDLFAFSDLIGPGLPLFTPRGTLLRDLIVEKIQSIQEPFGYQKVTIPHITKKDLYVTSGHWDKFKDQLFKVTGMSDAEFVMKPMNCPHHTQIYASRPRSYRDLPLRFAETTMVYRDEQAGELLGLARVRSITQDDGHVFCALDQVKTEIKNIISVIREFYSSLEMFEPDKYWVSLSVRDPRTTEKYLGDQTKWDQAEQILAEVATEEKLNYQKVEGEAAFYGPKLDFMFKDSLGRERQLATAQLDFVMPTRFGLQYTRADGKAETPVMIHRAVAGSLERFMAIMIEHFAGAFPVWLAPVQVKIVTVSEKFNQYARETLLTKLTAKKVRAELDDANESLGKKIRLAKTEKIPFILVVGEQEQQSGLLTVESRDHGKISNLSIDDFLATQLDIH